MNRDASEVREGQPASDHDDRARSRWSRLLETRARRAAAVIAALATAVGLATGTIQLVGLIVPNGKPATATITPSKLIEPDVQWGRYRDAHPEVAAGDFTSEQLKSYGVVFTVALTVKGLEGKTGTLKWLELDRNGSELQVPAWVPQSLEIRPGEQEELTPTVWTPLPTVVEGFLVKFEFYDHEEERRAFAESRLVEVGGQ